MSKVLPITAYCHGLLRLGRRTRPFAPPPPAAPRLSSSSRALQPRLAPRAAAAAAATHTLAAMDTAVQETIERLHSAPFKLVLYVTGGAAQAPSWLLSVPGASRTVLEVRVPYSAASLAEAIGAPPQGPSASAGTSVDLAVAAYRHAAKLTPFGAPIVGVGATCALATDRDRLGQHTAFVSVHTGLSTRTVSLVMDKGTRGRSEEDDLASRLVIDAVARAMGVGGADTAADTAAAGGLAAPRLTPGDALTADARALDRSSLLRDMLNGRFRALEFSGSGGGVVVDAPRPARVYLPGSFNPLHEGHKALLAAACRLCPGKEGAFELSVGNADKGLLPLAEVERRVAQFVAAGLPVVVTQAPLFTQKADLFPGSTFVVGYDTAERLVQERYYGAETAMLLQFARLAHQGCGFLVAGRAAAAGGGGRFLGLEDLEVPEVLRRGSLFRGIPAEEFRMDISSTELRERGARV